MTIAKKTIFLIIVPIVILFVLLFPIISQMTKSGKLAFSGYCPDTGTHLSESELIKGFLATYRTQDDKLRSILQQAAQGDASECCHINGETKYLKGIELYLTKALLGKYFYSISVIVKDPSPQDPSKPYISIDGSVDACARAGGISFKSYEAMRS